MHSKYILVDQSKLITGSFNWSHSAEYNHLENLVRMEGQEHASLLSAYAKDFENLWGAERQNYAQVLAKVKHHWAEGLAMDCNLEPMTLELEEIDQLLQTAQFFGSTPLTCAAP